MPPSREEFQRWHDDRVTRWVMAAHERIGADSRNEWIKVSWDNGISNPQLLQELRVRADSYRAIIDASYESYCETNEDTPIYD